MGLGPPWSPGAPPKSVQRIVRAPPCPAPAGVAAGGLAWVRTSGGVGLGDLRPGASMLGRVMLRHSRPLRGGEGVTMPPSSLEGLASSHRRLLVPLGPLSWVKLGVSFHSMQEPLYRVLLIIVNMIVHKNLRGFDIVHMFLQIVRDLWPDHLDGEMASSHLSRPFQSVVPGREGEGVAVELAARRLGDTGGRSIPEDISNLRCGYSPHGVGAEARC